MSLSVRDRELLAFEREWWRHAGTEDDAVRARFGLSPEGYHLALSRVVDTDDALAYDALLVRRLRRRRTVRRRERSARRLERTR